MNADRDLSVAELAAECGPELALAAPAQVWAGLTIERRRAVIDVLMRIVVLRTAHGNGAFDPATVRIEWR